MIALVVMTDGRDDCLRQAIRSAHSELIGPITELWLHDDSGDDEHRTRLRHEFPRFSHIADGPRRGFGGAIQYTWDVLRARSQAELIFWLEDDFTFRRPVDLAQLGALLYAEPRLAQVALRRQAWSSEEIRAGGVIEQHPDDYTDRDGWLEHTRFFTTNPSLFRHSLLQLGWPDGQHSEGHFTQRCLGAGLKFAYWGARYEAPAVEHIGHARVGTGY